MSSEFVASEITPLRRPDSNVSTAARLNATNNNNHTTNRNNNLNNNNNIHNNNVTIETRTQQQNIEMDRNQWIVYRRIMIDVFVLLCVGLPILGFYLWGEPYKRGFFCDDESIRHPFHESTIRNWMLYIIGLILPLVIMITTEIVLSVKQGSMEAPTKVLSWNIAPWMVELYKTVGIFAFGAVVSQLTVDIAKYTIGRLRPHFISVCQPLMPNNTTCSSQENIGRYIEDFECLGINSSPRMLKEMRLSFPSGHSSFTMYTMIYCVIYLNCRMTWRGSKLLKHALQFLLVMIAWFTALSRISNYKHHWSDVLAGGVIGALFALVVANYVSDLFDQKPEKPFLPTAPRLELGTQIPANGHV